MGSLQRILEVIGLVSMIYLFFLGTNSFYTILALLFWCETRLTKYWLKGNIKKAPFDALIISISLFFPTEQNYQLILIALAASSTLFRLYRFQSTKNEWVSGLSLTMRRSFWPTHRSQEALQELTKLGVDYKIHQRKILISCEESAIPQILAWGRGWIVEHAYSKPEKEESPHKLEPQSTFSLTWLLWKKSLPQGLDLEEKVTIVKYLLRIYGSKRISGKIKLNAKTCFWRKSGTDIMIYFANSRV